MFLSYCGLSTCNAPFYNHKNQTHPTFQSHPFLYNFENKPSSRAESLALKYVNLFKDEYSYGNVSRVIDDYIGKFGLAIDAWKTNAHDYTGYQTEYEESNHLTELGISSEVVGYEGSFYPPAAKIFVKACREGKLGRIASSLRNM